MQIYLIESGDAEVIVFGEMSKIFFFFIIISSEGWGDGDVVMENYFVQNEGILSQLRIDRKVSISKDYSSGLTRAG